ncbi:premnaspirodiene oxygenase-like [Rhodamnia argentea]|uniref:Premnaspirodiene oxygenase-like n=1 Tax=Rhodamnia argentea TaxID=178133 RepID=A0ABM3HZ36_9MYRT|nr:premnaspirodiene oxygenase-like [Rhodamnia argentea]
MLQLSSFSFFLSLLLFLFILVKLTSNRYGTKRFNLRLPPGPKKLPVIGNLHQMFGEPPHHRLTYLAKTYGPVFHLQLGQLPIITISTPEAAKEVLKTQELTFADRPQFQVAKMTSYDNSSMVFAPYGEYWRQIRKICVLELLSVKRVRSFTWARDVEVNNLIKHIESASGLPLNLSEKIFACTNSIVCKAAFGQNCKQQDELISSLQEAMRMAGGFGLAEVFPSLRFLMYINGMKYKLAKIKRKYDEILNTILADHKRQRPKCLARPEDSPDKEDLVDVLLRLQESNEIGFHLTMDNIKGVILEMIGGGSETSSTTLIWAMSEMLKNPKVMARAQNEIRRILKGKDRVRESDMEELDYLKCVIKETLRMHPPAPLIPRTAREGCKVEGYDIPMNSRVLINAYAMGRDPSYWTNPDKFEPERFIKSSVDYKGVHYQFLPFGSGRRVCPGIAFATAGVELILASLLYHYDWKPANGQASEQIDMTEVFGATVGRKDDLYVIASPWSLISA